MRYSTSTINGTYELAAKATESLTLKVQRTQASALTGFASISSAQLSYQTVATPDVPAAPDPTTATLSLLALAGLAARRRRK